MAVSQGIKILFVRAASLGNLCRFVCSFQNNDVLFSTNVKGKPAIAALGEQINKVQLVYYVNTDKHGKFINYEMLQQDAGERAELSNTAEFIPQSANRCSINVIHADFAKLEAKAQKKTKVTSIRLDSLLDLAKAAIRHSTNDEVLPHVYSFGSGSEWVFGAFDLLDELSDDNPIFYYTTARYDAGKAFIVYNYKDDSITFSNYNDEHAYFYIKIVRLAEPIPYVECA
ncbi:MAG: hypothetical protein QW091_00950 [Candidatus Micrarchaeaceae archaeon]